MDKTYLVFFIYNSTVVYLEGNLETKIFTDPVTGLVRRIREVAIRINGMNCLNSKDSFFYSLRFIWKNVRSWSLFLLYAGRVVFLGKAGDMQQPSSVELRGVGYYWFGILVFSSCNLRVCSVFFILPLGPFTILWQINQTKSNKFIFSYTGFKPNSRFKTNMKTETNLHVFAWMPPQSWKFCPPSVFFLPLSYFCSPVTAQ